MKSPAVLACLLLTATPAAADCALDKTETAFSATRDGLPAGE